VRTEILKDQEPPPTIIPLPHKMYIQQGDLILVKVNELPANAGKVEGVGVPDVGLALGEGHVLYPADKT
jgi:hypothetical protein